MPQTDHNTFLDEPEAYGGLTAVANIALVICNDVIHPAVENALIERERLLQLCRVTSLNARQ
jgi:hypothetical protein